MAATPGVRQAAAVNMLPIAEWGFNGNVNVEGMADEHRGFFAEYRWITRDYLRTMGFLCCAGGSFCPRRWLAGRRRSSSTKHMPRRRQHLGADLKVPDDVAL